MIVCESRDNSRACGRDDAFFSIVTTASACCSHTESSRGAVQPQISIGMFIMSGQSTYLIAPPVYSTENSSTAQSIKPNPRGAIGVSFDSGVKEVQREPDRSAE